MNETIRRSEYGTLNVLPDKHMTTVRREARDVTQQMIANVHNDPFLLSEYAVWLELNEQGGVKVPGVPEVTFILSQYNGGYKPLSAFIPVLAKQRFITSISGVIGEATPTPSRG